MPKTQIKIKTWNCNQCGYRQDYSPINNSKCNNCKNGNLLLETNEDKMMIVTIAGEEEADVREINEGDLKRKMNTKEKKEFKDKIKDSLNIFKTRDHKSI